MEGSNPNQDAFLGMGISVRMGEDGRIIPKKHNTLPVWGNATTMNLNSLIFTNIENSPYFTGRLTELKTYHEVVDEIYYKVTHLEPWERGSRQTGGKRQTGMCGGVRGVGVGGIISSAFCCLYKLFTMRITRNQLYGLINHGDSPYIRGVGFIYIRFTQPPDDLWEWFEPYIEDDEEVDAKAGGGGIITIGQMIRHLLTKLDWHSSLFPRIPVPIQMTIDSKLAALKHATSIDPTPRNHPERVIDKQTNDCPSPTPPQRSCDDWRSIRYKSDQPLTGSSHQHTRSDERESSTSGRRRSRSRDRYTSSRSVPSEKKNKDRPRSRSSHRRHRSKSRSPRRGHNSSSPHSSKSASHKRSHGRSSHSHRRDRR